MRLSAPCQGLAAICSISLLIACSGADGGPVDPGGVGGAAANTGGATAAGLGGANQGGQVGSGGTTASPSVGGAATGGTATGGATNSGNGGASTGGSAVGGNATGGKSAGGTATGGSAVGGSATGGKSAGGATTGGNATGGKSAGGTTTGGNAAGGNAVGGSATGGAATGGRSTGGSATGGAATATGGAATATGGAGTCSPTWSPPASANGNTSLPAGLDQVWAHSGSVIQAASNIKIHQVMANKGIMRYCVRWDSTTTINATERDQLEALIQKNEKQWWDQLKGWGCWPYTDIPTSVTVWAARNRTYLNWDDSTTTAKVVVNSTAECPTDCGTWAPGKAFSSCSSAIYDEFFWLDGTVTTFTGWGSATGFMMGAASFLSSAKSNASTFVILAHEMGHAHGMDDFYDWQPSGWTSWVMNAGSASAVTETDGWMLRDIWRHVRSKYGYPGP